MGKKEDDPDGPPTPIAGSGTYPALQVAAREVAARLQREVGTVEALKLAAQLNAIAALFRSWTPSTPPTDDERKRLTDELIEANKRAAVLFERRR